MDYPAAVTLTALQPLNSASKRETLSDATQFREIQNMFGIGRKAQNSNAAAAQREAELEQIEAQRKAYLAGLQAGRREVYNEKNQPVAWSVETAEKVIRTHLGKSVRPDVPMRRMK
jgi:hypothetical protein